MNYSELVTQVKDYLETDETTFNAHIDEFIELAEERICRAVLFPELRKNSTGTCTTSNQYLSLPSDWLAVYSLACSVGGTTGYVYLKPKDVSFIRAAFPLVTTTGVPKFYGIFDDDTLILGPTPDSGYTMELHYFYQPTPMSGSNTTTWIGDNCQKALLFGTIVEAYTFLKGDPDLLKIYEEHYRDAMSSLIKLGEGLNQRDSFRDGEIRRAKREVA